MLWDSNEHVHQVSSNSERVWCSPLSYLTWNDPYLKDSIWSTPSVYSVEQKAKPKGHGPTLEETRPDHAIRSSVAIPNYC